MQRILILIAANLFLASCSTTQHYSTATISATSELCNTQQTSAEIFRNGEKVIVEYFNRRSGTYLSYPVIALGAYNYSEQRQREFDDRGDGASAPHYRRGSVNIQVTTPEGRCFVPLLTVVKELYVLPRAAGWYGIDRKGEAFGKATLNHTLEFTLFDRSNNTAFLSNTLHSTFSRLYIADEPLTTSEQAEMETALKMLKATQRHAAKKHWSDLENEEAKRIQKLSARKDAIQAWRLKSAGFMADVKVGDQVCKYGPLTYHSAFHGQRKGDEDGYLVASVSSVASDRKRIKLLIEGLWSGFKGKNDFITDVPKVGNINVSPGTELWDSTSEWGVCDF